jgi:hypothetical protein
MINSAMLNPLMGITITEKLGKANHAMWKAQILAAVRGSRLVDHLTGASSPIVLVNPRPPTHLGEARRSQEAIWYFFIKMNVICN